MTASLELDLMPAIREELSIAAPDVPPDAESGAHLRHDLEVDSLALLEFVARLEYRFSVVVPDDEWSQLSTLDNVEAYLREALSES